MSTGITLSAATRANLLSLQGTADLLATTQNRLATNKKVNSALDNPTNFFTADSLSSRSAGLSKLLDGISNGIQAIQTANTGLTKLQGLTDQLKSVAQQALSSANAFSTKATNTSVALTGATASNLLSTGPTQAVSDTALGVAGTAVAAVAQAGPAYGNGVASATAPGTFTTLTVDRTVTLNGKVINLAGGDTIDVAVGKINQQSAITGVTASYAGNRITLTGGNDGAQFTYSASSTETGFNPATNLTDNGAGAASTNVTINGTDIAIATGSTMAQAMAAINAYTSITGVTATNAGNSIRLTGPADGGKLTLRSGTGNQAGFANLISNSPGTFHPTDTTLAISLGFTAGDSFTVNGQSVSVAAGETLTSLAQKVTVATNGTVSATFDATNRKFNFTAADSSTGITLGNGSTATALVSNLGYSVG
ncbi:flagellin hook IN motif-containing protein, partial [Methylobacterium gossipiicola]